MIRRRRKKKTRQMTTYSSIAEYFSSLLTYFQNQYKNDIFSQFYYFMPTIIHIYHLFRIYPKYLRMFNPILAPNDLITILTWHTFRLLQTKMFPTNIPNVSCNLLSESTHWATIRAFYFVIGRPVQSLPYIHYLGFDI